MQQIKPLIRRLLMTCLFIGALLTTFHSITGLDVTDLKQSLLKSDQVVHGKSVLKTFTVNKSIFTEKTLNKLEHRNTMVSDEVVNQPKKLSDTLELEKYPKHKVVATGYTAGVESTGKKPGDPSYGITYSGVKVRRDLYSTIAADPHVFPIGTILFIPGYGYGVVADTGSAINGNKLDLYFDTVDDVYRKWGKKETEVYIIKKGKGTLSEQALKKLNNTKALQVFREQIVNG